MSGLEPCPRCHPERSEGSGSRDAQILSEAKDDWRALKRRKELAVCLCPWTDMDNSYKSLKENEPYDWIEQRMVVRWAQWFCREADPKNPLVSPVHADLRGLPPIYIQAGDAELLIDMIRVFVGKAKAQGASVSLFIYANLLMGL